VRGEVGLFATRQAFDVLLRADVPHFDLAREILRLLVRAYSPQPGIHGGRANLADVRCGVAHGCFDGRIVSLAGGSGR